MYKQSCQITILFLNLCFINQTIQQIQVHCVTSTQDAYLLVENTWAPKLSLAMQSWASHSDALSIIFFSGAIKSCVVRLLQRFRQQVERPSTQKVEQYLKVPFAEAATAHRLWGMGLSLPFKIMGPFSSISDSTWVSSCSR